MVMDACPVYKTNTQCVVFSERKHITKWNIFDWKFEPVNQLQYSGEMLQFRRYDIDIVHCFHSDGWRRFGHKLSMLLMHCVDARVDWMILYYIVCFFRRLWQRSVVGKWQDYAHNLQHSSDVATRIGNTIARSRQYIVHNMLQIQ